MVILKKWGVDVDKNEEKIEEEKMWKKKLKIGVKLWKIDILKEMIRKEKMRKIRNIESIEREDEGVVGGEDGMVGRMKIMSEKEILDLKDKEVEDRDDLIEKLEGKGEEGEKIIMEVDKKKWMEDNGMIRFVVEEKII